MARSLWNEHDRRLILDRITRLTPYQERRWGTLTLPKMVTHIGDQLQIALGEIPTRPARGLLRLAPVRWLVIHLLPWPKGVTRGPREAFQTSPGKFEDDRRTVTHLIDRFVYADRSGRWPSHPMFGAMSAEDWGVLTWRHLDHHLRQFGR